ncbi:MAG: cell division ATP-binding protein FtsE [bacterium]|nr:cell division ATP-binding protein FtsE [bacterium]
MIAFQGVSVVYPNGVTALRDLDLKIEKGDFLFLVGPTGSGKSTILKLIYREEVCTSGRIIVAGKEITGISRRQIPYLRRGIGVVFQDFKLLPRRTAWDNVAFALHVIGVGRMEVKRQAAKALDSVGLLHKADALPTELSAGEQQRVCIARAIVNNPVILVADEPTGNLDPDTSWDIVQLLSRINVKGTTVIMATHDRSIVDRMRKRVIALQNGRLVRDEDKGAYIGEL